ncbi:terminase small subunit [Bowmanella sp. JS7-9]|uniref:Terminase small subunit n=1 Tax=Pseudobowmanella zhangzhouensis TaxID=1537679 RepID=A0ABW1XP17_9ALTE|nr:terminase small subunit [Bowmanella sp. JS7-9]TBX21917.1 hypothetical protein TK45_10530 [Bowmanella sp. JS7-9]
MAGQIIAKSVEQSMTVLEELAEDLNKRQLEFAQQYLADPKRDHAKAYMAAYENCGSLATADACGKRLLRHGTPTREYIDACLLEARTHGFMKLRINEEFVLNELFKLAAVNIKDFYDHNGNMLPIHQIADEAAAGVSKIRERVIKRTRDDEEGVEEELVQRDLEIADKKGALNLLGQHLAMFTQKHQHDISGEMKVAQFFDAISQEVTDSLVSPLPADNLRLDTTIDSGNG